MAHLIDWEKIDRATISYNGIAPDFYDKFHMFWDTWDPKQEVVYNRLHGFSPYPQWLKRMRHNQALRKSIAGTVEFRMRGVYRVHGTDSKVMMFGRTNVQRSFSRDHKVAWNSPEGIALGNLNYMKLYVGDDGVQFCRRGKVVIRADEEVEMTDRERDIFEKGIEAVETWEREEERRTKEAAMRERAMCRKAEIEKEIDAAVKDESLPKDERERRLACLAREWVELCA